MHNPLQLDRILYMCRISHQAAWSRCIVLCCAVLYCMVFLLKGITSIGLCGALSPKSLKNPLKTHTSCGPGAGPHHCHESMVAAGAPVMRRPRLGIGCIGRLGVRHYLFSFSRHVDAFICTYSSEQPHYMLALPMRSHRPCIFSSAHRLNRQSLFESCVIFGNMPILSMYWGLGVYWVCTGVALRVYWACIGGALRVYCGCTWGCTGGLFGMF